MEPGERWRQAGRHRTGRVYTDAPRVQRLTRLAHPRTRIAAATGYVMGATWAVVCAAFGFHWPTVLIGAGISGLIAATAKPR
jgi:hypothetical protein